MSAYGWRKNLSSLNKGDYLPRVVIAGRPNVGKSTLFNRLAGKRRAITDPTPGVTRDAVDESCEIAGREVILTDTGGYKLEHDDFFDPLVAKRSVDTIKTASLILFLVDPEEMTGEDESMVDILRPYSDKLILVVNKIDHPEKEDLLWNYYSLGFEHVLAVSATHNRGLGALKSLIVKKLAENPGKSGEGWALPDLTLTILGKPNAGKSTLLNRLTGNDLSIVSPIPGTTRDIVEGWFEFQGKRIRLLDTAGIRKKRKVSENVEYYSVNRAISAIEESDVVLLLIDSIEGLSDQDKKIAAQIVKHGKGVVLVLNKWDLNETGDVAAEKKAIGDIRFFFPILSFAPVSLISAQEGSGIKALLKKSMKINDQLKKRIETSKLNEALEEWVDYNPPPSVDNKSYKVKYLTQVSTEPLKFLLFVNHKKSFPQAYSRYIMNQLRKEFGFENVPIDMEIRKSGKERS